MNICLLAICFYRDKEISSSLKSIIETVDSSTNLKLGLLEIISPKSNLVTKCLQDLNFKNKQIYHLKENNVSGALITISLNTDILNNVDFVAVTETDIRLLAKRTIEKGCEILKNNINIGVISPEYETSNKYHYNCFNKWVIPRININTDISYTSAQGFQLLIFRKNDWVNFCKDVKNGKFIKPNEKSYGIIDQNLKDWIIPRKIAILKNFKMIHTGWDVYDNPSCDQEYLDFKNTLHATNNIWSPNTSKGNEIIEYTVE